MARYSNVKAKIPRLRPLSQEAAEGRAMPPNPKGTAAHYITENNVAKPIHYRNNNVAKPIHYRIPENNNVAKPVHYRFSEP